jgi:DNA-binding NtrC family response regulator
MSQIHEPTYQGQDQLHSVGEIRVLVLDDDSSISRVVQAALAPAGFSVDAVCEPEAMRAALQAKQYHLIIMDYVIPGLESEQMLAWVQEYQPEASVIVMTAFPTIDSALQCLRAHAYDYLTKPFDLEHLQSVVNRCLESKGLLRMSEEALRGSLGSAIRERRRSLGLTLAQMSQRTNLSLGYLSQIELGKNSASIETLYRISLGLGIKMADLFQAVQASLP